MSILRNFIRQVAPLKNFKLESFYSTAAELTSEQKTNDYVLSAEKQPELDKLYKRVELEIKGNDPAVLKSYSWFSKLAADHLGVEVGKSWAIRKAEKERFTVYKSVHIFKRHKVQYEIRTYYQFLHLHRLTSSTADTLLEYLERNLPEGVAMKVTKFEICKKPDYLLQPPDSETQS